MIPEKSPTELTGLTSPKGGPTQDKRAPRNTLVTREEDRDGGRGRGGSLAFHTTAHNNGASSSSSPFFNTNKGLKPDLEIARVCLFKLIIHGKTREKE
jgi:hypothetical protein